jgi:hypothetical protein
MAKRKQFWVLGAVAVLLVLMSISLWANRRRERPEPKTIPELIERLKEADPGLCFVPVNSLTGDLADGVYIADHPITWTETASKLRADAPAAWQGIILIRSASDDMVELDLDRPYGAWEGGGLFVVGDPSLIDLVRKHVIEP